LIRDHTFARNALNNVESKLNNGMERSAEKKNMVVMHNRALSEKVETIKTKRQEQDVEDELHATIKVGEKAVM
jgi:translation initiation factor RLI1